MYTMSVTRFQNVQMMCTIRMIKLRGAWVRSDTAADSGFLDENADFAEKCLKLGIGFIGPKPESIRLMGSKAAAKQLMELSLIHI